MEKEPPIKKKNPAAVRLGRLGGAKGGLARKKALSQEERSAIARKGALARAKKLSPEQRSEIARKASHSRKIMAA
jgi:hypothetical protein